MPSRSPTRACVTGSWRTAAPSNTSAASPRWIIDNLKADVDKADREEPRLNPSFAEFARHYRVAVLPARSGRATDKGLVEASVGAVQSRILLVLRHESFFSLEAMNAAIRRELDRFNQAPMACGETRRALFEANERALPKPLPRTPWEWGEWIERKVAPSCHVRIAYNHYSVPERHIGRKLALLANALWTRTDSDETGELAASRSEANRLRLGIEGSREFTLDGGVVTPRLELGVRHDGGDAETGGGVEVGGGVSFTSQRLGLVLDVSGRALLAHEAEDFRDRGISASLTFDPDPESKRGASFALRRDLGGPAAGGLDALFASEPLAKRAGGRSDGWRAEAAWGLPAFGGRFTGSPFLAWGLSAGARDYDVGWRLEPEAAGAPDLSLALKATRREAVDDTTNHGVGLDLTARW